MSVADFRVDQGDESTSPGSAEEAKDTSYEADAPTSALSAGSEVCDWPVTFSTSIPVGTTLAGGVEVGLGESEPG